MAEVDEFVRHYMRKLEKETDESEILRILNRLRRVRVTLELLQSTGIGKMVQNIKKRSKGEVELLAGAIVAEWKEKVYALDKSGSTKKTGSERRPKDVNDRKNGDRTRTQAVLEGHHRSDPKRSTLTDSVETTYGPVEPSSRKYDSNTPNTVRVSKTDSKCRNGDNPVDGSGVPIENVYFLSALNGSSVACESTKREKTKSKTGSSNSVVSKHVKKLSRVSSESGFNASMASFEDALILNDVRSVKKKKAATGSSVASASVSAGKKQCRTVKESSLATNKNAEIALARIETCSPVTVAPMESSSWTDSVSKMVNFSDINVMSTLPEIQPIYKPQRHIEIDSPPKKPKPAVAELDDGAFMSSRHNRTQVFSGRRSHVLQVVPTLQDACLRVIQDNIQDFTYLGGVPYLILEPVLQRCTPVQLYTLEDHNNYLIEDTDGLWEKHCKRDFKNPSTDEFETWRELYLRLYDEREARLKSITANISASMAKAIPVRKTKLAFVDCEVKPPRSIARKQAKFGTGQPSPLNKSSTIIKSSSLTKSVSRPSVNNASVGMAVTKQPDPGPSNSPAVVVPPPPVSNAQQKVVKKVAPLMQKTLKQMKCSFRR